MDKKSVSLRQLVIGILILAAIFPFATALRSSQATGNGPMEIEEGDELILRQQYWKERRGELTEADVVAAREYAKGMPKQALPPPVRTAGNSAILPSVPNPPSGTWSLVGPNPISNGVNYSGRIPAIAVDKTTSGASTVIYLGGANGGVWKSTNNGTSWTPLGDTQSSLAIGAIAIDPNNNQVIYAGTGEPNQSQDSYYGVGVLKSTNGGTTWTLYGNALFGTRTNSISRIVVNPLNSNQLFASSSLGLTTSTDAGVTWTKMTAGLPNSGNFVADDVVIDASSSPIKIYTIGRSGFGGTGYGVYKSSDGGASFAQQTTGLPAAASNFNYRSRMAIAPSNPNVLYLVTVNSSYKLYSSGTYNGGYWTTDGGATWNSMAAMTADPADGGFGGQGWYDLNVAVDPLNDSLIYVAGVDVHSATNARGTSATGGWRNITNVYSSPNSGIHPDQHALAFGACAASPCRLYVGNDGGIFYTDNGNAAAASVTYTNLNNALAIAEFVGGDIGPNFGTTPLALGGTQDNGTMRYNGAAVWPVVRGGDGGFARINYSNPSVMYGEQYSLSIARSTNGGTSWSSITSGITGTPLFYAPFNIDRTDSNHLVYGTDRVNETLNGTSPWYQGSAQLEGGTQISALAIAPSNGAVIYAGLTNGHIYKTTAGKSGSSAAYTQVSTGIGSNQWVNDFFIDPADPNTVYVVTGRFYRASGTGFIYKTTNGGTSWSSISSNLPNLPVNSIAAYTSTVGRVLVVGNDAGVFFSTNDGSTWSALNNGLPLSAVNQVVIDPALTTILAFTHGRSVWKLALTTGVVPTATNTATNTPVPPRPDTIGVYNAGTFYLRNTNNAGAANITASFGGDPSDLPVAGDWNGDGVDTIGVYRGSTGVYFLSDSNTSPAVNYSLVFGNPGDTPFAGKWTADMTHDGVGVYRNSNGILYQKKQLTTGFSDYFAIYGNPGDQGVGGDWDGNGFDSVGIYRSSNLTWFLSNNSTPSGITFSDINFVWDIGTAKAVVGDWDGNLTTTVGFFNTSGVFDLHSTNAAAGSDNVFAFGPSTGYPIAGKWIAGPLPPLTGVIGNPGNQNGSSNTGDNSSGD
jgi:hypothetical protein